MGCKDMYYSYHILYNMDRSHEYLADVSGAIEALLASFEEIVIGPQLIEQAPEGTPQIRKDNKC